MMRIFVHAKNEKEARHKVRIDYHKKYYKILRLRTVKGYRAGDFKAYEVYIEYIE